MDLCHLERKKAMRKRITTASAAAVILFLLLTNSSWAIIFMPEKRADGFLDKLPSGLSEAVNQNIVKEAKTVMIHQPRESSEKGKDLLLKAKVRNKPPQAIVVLHYRHQEGKPFFTREMSTVDDSTFSYQLPGYLLSDVKIEYYLEVISATNIYAQSGNYFQPHGVKLISKSNNVKHLFLGLLLLAGVFMVLRMGWLKNKVSVKVAK